MYFNISSWQKIVPGLYDTGSAIVAVRQKFRTSIMAVFFGIVCIASTALSTVPAIVAKEFDVTHFAIAFVMLGIPGLWLVWNGWQGTKLRKENGGVHPTDSVYTINRDGDVRLRIGDHEERLAALNEVQFTIVRQRGRNTTFYKIFIAWPNGKAFIATKHSQKDADNLLNDIRTRLGLAPQIAQ